MDMPRDALALTVGYLADLLVQERARLQDLEAGIKRKEAQTSRLDVRIIQLESAQRTLKELLK